MNLHGRRWWKAIYLICFGLILANLCSCSQEAKKDRHWKRGEKYFAENKFREAVIEYKNVVQIDPKDANLHKKATDLLGTIQSNDFKDIGWF